MYEASERILRLRFMKFVRYELVYIGSGSPMFRLEHSRLIRMIQSMRLSGYLTRGQAAALCEAADRSLTKATALLTPPM